MSGRGGTTAARPSRSLHPFFEKGSEAVAGNLCFFYAIFKKLQCTAGGQWATNSEHFDPDESMTSDLSGGFSLRSMTDTYGGLLQKLGPNAATHNYDGTNFN